MTDLNVTAQDAAAEAGQTVFRLRGLTEFRDDPIPSSPVTGWLPEGSLVTVKADAGLFLYVLTADGRLGYIRDTAPVTIVQGPSSGGGPEAEAERLSRRRDALVLLGKVQADAERARQAPAGPDVPAGMAAIVSAAIGLFGLLTAHAITDLTNKELAVFFAYDVLLPLGVLPFAVATAGPKAPLVIYALTAAAYLAVLTGYVST